ncbi:MAG: GDYXXLXY domain-containing protein [Gammaproteobacteria bacterium]|nr:GDYXXLXY domain-containing protein [Gammaproteobacteria bacterium]MCW8959638.1 GDYXXLXY domain-containing protein [Gammaproteobacteria bacterium]MCW8973969.1 GDYXXLXY domain-containing protein [Gammaproteobacteria bacterium]MCW8993789.1 GDYXXLXY domain-containing protein [Gammaproteobacteria bacterium]
MKLRPVLIGLAVAFQIGVVAAMVLSREWILAYGTPYTFQTAPIDPRDIFRGDYVRLDYLFSNVAVAQLEPAIIEQGLRKGRKVYLALEQDINGIHHGGRLYRQPPAGQPWLAGRVRYDWPYRGYRRLPPERRAEITPGPVAVKYGIEQYYLEQGSGLAIEERRGGRNDYQLPMLIHARVSASGEAVIHSYSWADIAVKTEVLRTPEREAEVQQASAVIQMSLQNRGESVVTLPLRRGNCSFTLIGAQRAPEDATRFAAERTVCMDAPLEPVTLAPGEVHAVRFDLNRPHWQVIFGDKPTPMGRLSWNYRYRIVYRGEPLPGVKGAILSRAFHGRGNID